MIGDPVNRTDGRLKVTGAAHYTAEQALDGLVYGVIVQSTIARGRITRIDNRAALAVPGVIGVLSADNAPKLASLSKGAANPPAGRVLTLFQDHGVRYNGEPVALVLADSFEAATHGASLVAVHYEPEAAVTSLAEALPHATVYSQKILGSIEPAMRRGDVDAGLAHAHTRTDQQYTTPLETHNAMETHATIAVWNNDQLTLYDSTQYVYGVKRFMAKIFTLPEANVHVISRFAGGAFGSKGSAWSHVGLAAMAAQKIGRPVKVVLTRRQMFGLVGARPYTVQQVALGADADGKLTAIRHHATTSTSTFEDWVEPSTLQTRLLYPSPAIDTGQKLARMNIGTPTFNRGPGESSGTFALETAMDELAEKLAIDPIELRLRNYAETDPETGKPFSSKSLRECYGQGAAKIGWEKRSAIPGSRRDGDWLIGLGMSTATYPMRRSPATALIRMLPSGDVLVQAATHEIGTGTYTVMSQIVADVLGIPLARVRFELGDSDLPENPISAGSMTAASTGSAVFSAATALKEKLATRNGNEPVEVRVESRPGDETKQYSMHAFGAVFAEVRVDPDLGVVRLSRIVGAYGAGRILNAKTARSQILGGITYGIGMALTEMTEIDPHTARYVNADLGEYHLPVNADVPEIDAIFVDEHDPYVNPLGVKGIGEVGTTGVAAAIANAVYNAAGIRVRDLPITLDKLLGGPRWKA